MKLTKKQLKQMIIESLVPQPKSSEELSDFYKRSNRQPGSFSNPIDDFFEDQFKKRNPEYVNFKNKIKNKSKMFTTKNIIHLHDGEIIEVLPNGIALDASDNVVIVVVPKKKFSDNTLEKSVADYLNVDVDLNKKMKISPETWLDLYAEYEEDTPYKIVAGDAALNELDQSTVLVKAFPNRKKKELKKQMKDYLGLE